MAEQLCCVLEAIFLHELKDNKVCEETDASNGACEGEEAMALHLHSYDVLTCMYMYMNRSRTTCTCTYIHFQPVKK